ncbi:MAG: cation:proton antiporter [Acidaminococcaceae bacterium]|jgi:Kef-type K+ transport system membrane component KefB|nr:cation:proton antiporter [Acidaminococcaceae bacterium]
MSNAYLLDIIIISLATALLSFVAPKIKLPAVVGAILAGLIIGPSFLGLLKETVFISEIAQIGVIFLMFTAGIETDIAAMKKVGKAGFAIASLGVLAPIILGGWVAYLFNDSVQDAAMLQNVFVGVVLTATSVSITVQTLRELGKLNTDVGNAILVAAVIDDVLGLICITVVSSLVNKTVSVPVVLLKIVAFFALAAVTGKLAQMLFNKMGKWLDRRTINGPFLMVHVLCFCFGMAYVAETYFGVADIIGAFLAGLVLRTTPLANIIDRYIQPVSVVFLNPIFFANIGLTINLHYISPTLLYLSLALVAVAVVSKLIGCGLGAKLCGFSFKKSVQVGCGMICRGEVGLIAANKGMELGLMPSNFMPAVVVVVCATAIITPILLKIVMPDTATDMSVHDVAKWTSNGFRKLPGVLPRAIAVRAFHVHSKL